MTDDAKKQAEAADAVAILATLLETHGNHTAAAALLGVRRRTFDARIVELLLRDHVSRVWPRRVRPRRPLKLTGKK